MSWHGQGLFERPVGFVLGSDLAEFIQNRLKILREDITLSFEFRLPEYLLQGDPILLRFWKYSICNR